MPPQTDIFASIAITLNQFLADPTWNNKMAGQFTKKAVDIEALMAQAAALEAEAAKEKEAPAKKGKKEKKEKEKKPKKEKEPSSKKEKVKKEKKETTKKESSKKESTKKESTKKESKKDGKKKSSKSKKGGAPEKSRKVFGVPLQELELEDDCMPAIYTELVSVLEGYGNTQNYNNDNFPFLKQKFKSNGSGRFIP